MGGLRGTGLVPEGSTRHRVSVLPEGDAHPVPQDQAAQSGLWGRSRGEDGMQGPKAAAAAMKGQWPVGLHRQEKNLEVEMMGLEQSVWVK